MSTATESEERAADSALASRDIDRLEGELIVALPLTKYVHCVDAGGLQAVRSE